MVKYYYNVKDNFIDKFNGVKGTIGTSEDLDFGEYEWIELSESQATRFKEGSKDLTYIITGTATPEPEPTLEEKKAIKSNTLNANLKVQIDAGYTYNTWNYPISDNTVNNIIKQETLIKIAERKNVTMDSFQLTDGSNIDRTFTLSQYSDFALGYAILTAKIEKWYATKRNLITNAQNETALNDIDLDFPSEE